MKSDWPSGLDQFGEFLQTQGLSFDRRGLVPYTGDKIWQYSTSKIGARLQLIEALYGAFKFRILLVGRRNGTRLPN
jgi:hypothetical protein